MSTTNVVRTAAAGLIQTGQYLDVSIPVMANSTLNEKLNIATDAIVADTDRVSVNLAVIGYGGHGLTMGSNNRVKWEKYLHKARHSGLFAQVPFAMRPVSSDFTVSQRAKYRLRTVERHNSVDYVCYYGRVIDKTNVVVTSEYRQVRDGVTTTTPFGYTLDDLNPTPTMLSTGQVVETNGDYIASTAKVPFVMTEEDVAEFLNVIEIIDGDLGYAIISEFATVASIDRAITQVIGGVSQTYLEAIQARITSFAATGFVAEHLTSGFTVNLDIGNVEPLFAQT